MWHAFHSASSAGTGQLVVSNHTGCTEAASCYTELVLNHQSVNRSVSQSASEAIAVKQVTSSVSVRLALQGVKDLRMFFPLVPYGIWRMLNIKHQIKRWRKKMEKKKKKKKKGEKDE